jgi:outer membrane lipoprotein-sorting protein
MRPLLLGTALLAAGCPHNGGGGGSQPSGPAPTVPEIVDRLAKQRDQLHAFKAESVMDYWLGKDRVKGTVYVMADTGKKVRFNAINPTGDVMADLACDGTNFVYLDYRNNCVLRGPCTKSSIAQLLHVELEPEDFLYLALGAAPVLPEAKGEVKWDGDKGSWRVDLTAPAGTQTIMIDPRDQHWDVVETERKYPDGKMAWSVENTDFHDAKDEDGKTSHRIPGKTRFKSPQQEADLIVEWKEQHVNPTLDPTKFSFTPPDGLPTCGQTRSAAAQP